MMYLRVFYQYCCAAPPILTQFIALVGKPILPSLAHKFVIAGRADPAATPGVQRCYFLRKRSSRTTSPPPLFSLGAGSADAAWAAGASIFSIAAGGDAGVGILAAALGSSAACLSRDSNWKPNCTAGAKNAVPASNGTARRSGTPPNDKPTSKPSSSTVKSQN